VHFISACFLVFVELIFETVQIRCHTVSLSLSHTHKHTHTHTILGKLVQLSKQIEICRYVPLTTVLFAVLVNSFVGFAQKCVLP